MHFRFSYITFLLCLFLTTLSLPAQNKWRVVHDWESSLTSPKTYVTYGSGKFHYAHEDGSYLRKNTLDLAAPTVAQYLNSQFNGNLVDRSVPSGATLDIHYRISSGEYQATYSHGQYVRLPYPAAHTKVAEGDGTYGIVILSATLHHNDAQQNSYDVTTALKNKLYRRVAIYDYDFALRGISLDKNGYTILTGGSDPYYSSDPAYYHINTPQQIYNPYHYSQFYDIISVGYSGYPEVEISGIAYGNGTYVAGVRNNAYESYAIESVESVLPHATSFGYFSSPYQSTLPEGCSIEDITFANGIFVAAGYFQDRRTYCIYSSSDGINWSISFLSSSRKVYAVTYSGSEWYAGGENNILYRSTNGFTWQAVATTGIEGDITELAAGNGFTVAGTADGGIYVSKNGTLWGKRYQSEHAIQNIAVSEDRFIASSGDMLLESTFSLPGYPEIISHTPQQFLTMNDDFLLEVEATGDATLTYQWYLGETGDTSQPIDGATASTYQTPALTESTSYWVRVTNELGSDDSYTIELTVQTPPTITQQPTGTTIDMGAYLKREITVEGYNLSYQWYEGYAGDISQPIPYETESTLSIFPDTPGTFYYWLRVSNDAGHTDSVTIAITVNPIYPQITSQPQDATIYTGSSKSVSVSTTGPDITYTWYHGYSGNTSNPIANNNYSFLFPDDDVPGTYRYWVRVSNNAGYVDSRTVTVTVIGQAPTFYTQPQGFTTLQGESQEIALDIKYSPSLITYRWYTGESGDTSQLISGASTRSYTPPVDTAGTFKYWARISNEYGNTDTGTLTVIVRPDSYTSWLAQEGLPTDGTGNGHPEASKGTDGIPNIIRYLMGANGSENLSGTSYYTLGTVLVNDSTQSTIQYRKRNDVSGATLIAEESTDMSNWTPAVLLYAIDSGDGSTTYTYRTSSTGGSAFIRLRAAGY